MRRRVAVYAGTRNLYHKMAVAAKSLTAHTRMDKIVFLTEDDTFPEWLPDIVEIKNVSGQTWFRPDGPNFVSHWTWMTMMRVVIPWLLPDEDMALSLDVDTIVTDDVGSLFDTDLGDNVIGMVEEPTRSKNPFKYFNMGVALMDIPAMNGWGIVSELVETLNKRKLDFIDQDAVNMRCQGRILPISPIWNSCQFTREPLDARIIHFAANRQYENERLFKQAESMEWKVRTNEG